MQISFGDARPADAAAIKAISAITMAEHHARQPDLFPLGAENPVDRWVDAILAAAAPAPGAPATTPDPDAPFGRLIACRRGADVLGHALIVFSHGPIIAGARERDAALYDISLHPDARAQGLGTQLMQRVIALARDQGATRLTAMVWQGNDASAALMRQAELAATATLFQRRLAPPQVARDDHGGAGTDAGGYGWKLLVAAVVIGAAILLLR